MPFAFGKRKEKRGGQVLHVAGIREMTCLKGRRREGRRSMRSATWSSQRKMERGCLLRKCPAFRQVTPNRGVGWRPFLPKRRRREGNAAAYIVDGVSDFDFVREGKRKGRTAVFFYCDLGDLPLFISWRRGKKREKNGLRLTSTFSKLMSIIWRKKRRKGEGGDFPCATVLIFVEAIDGVSSI